MAKQSATTTETTPHAPSSGGTSPSSGGTSPERAAPARGSSASKTKRVPSTTPRRSAKAATFDRKALGTIKGQLTAQREQLLEQLREIEDSVNAVQPDISGEISFDEDSADAGSFTLEREKDLSIAHNVRDLLGKMAKALDKIDAGTYGVCESCGQPIEAARVKALPHVLLCLSCKKAEERR